MHVYISTVQNPQNFCKIHSWVQLQSSRSFHTVNTPWWSSVATSTLQFFERSLWWNRLIYLYALCSWIFRFKAPLSTINYQSFLFISISNQTDSCKDPCGLSLLKITSQLACICLSYCHEHSYGLLLILCNIFLLFFFLVPVWASMKP